MSIADLVAACDDTDARAVLTYLRRHIKRAERLGLRVSLVSDKQLARDTRYRDVNRACVAGVYRVGARVPWLHLAHAAVEAAMRHPRELEGLLGLLEDATIDTHYARTGRVLRPLRVHTARVS